MRPTSSSDTTVLHAAVRRGNSILRASRPTRVIQHSASSGSLLHVHPSDPCKRQITIVAHIRQSLYLGLRGRNTTDGPEYPAKAARARLVYGATNRCAQAVDTMLVIRTRYPDEVRMSAAPTSILTGSRTGALTRAKHPRGNLNSTTYSILRGLAYKRSSGRSTLDILVFLIDPQACPDVRRLHAVPPRRVRKQHDVIICPRTLHENSEGKAHSQTLTCPPDRRFLRENDCPLLLDLRGVARAVRCELGF